MAGILWKDINTKAVSFWARLWCVLILMLLSPVASASQSSAHTLVIGAISSNPQKTVAKAQVFADYLVSQLSDFGYTQAKVKVAQDIEQMQQWLLHGEVDLLSESLYTSSYFINRGLVTLAGLRLKGGYESYHSVFYTRIDSGLDTLDTLVGKILVFEDRGSTSAFYEPAAILLDMGYQLIEITSPRATVPEGYIGFLFADELTAQGGEMNMWMWVYNHIVAASVFSNLDWQKKIPSHLKRQFQIIHKSEAIPRSTVLIRKNMASSVQSQLRSAMYMAHQSEAGREALQQYRDTTKILPVSPEMVSITQQAFARKARVDRALHRD